MYTYFISYRYWHDDKNNTGFARCFVDNESPINSFDEVEKVESLIGEKYQRKALVLNFILLSSTDDSEMKNKKWQIESVDRYYYHNGRNSKEYVELTFWYHPITCERKDTKRTEFISDGEEYKLPDWCHSCQYRKSLNH